MTSGWEVDPAASVKPRPKRQSIRPTYDSRETGPAYHVTTQLGDRLITFHEPMSDSFIHTRVTLVWRDVLRELLHRRRIQVTVIVGGDPDRVDDVLELDANTLTYNSTRRDTWNSHLNERLAQMGEKTDFD